MTFGVRAASPPLSITIIIASASTLALCHHVNTLYCTLITADKDMHTPHTHYTWLYIIPPPPGPKC